jgi:hypothetical protein
MSLTSTIWPLNLPVPQALRDWLSELFMTVDSKAESSGEKLAALFTSDGVMYGMQGKAVGSEGKKKPLQFVSFMYALKPLENSNCSQPRARLESCVLPKPRGASGLFG